MNDHDRIADYVHKHFAEHAAWPTVRQCAMDLGWTDVQVEDAIEGDPKARCYLSSYATHAPVKLGDHFVEMLQAKEGA